MTESGLAVAAGATAEQVDAGAAGTRLAYAVVSPQRWIEDFGSGQLLAGKAAASFTVRALDGRQCTVAFDYRIVAALGGDETRRFEQFTVDE